MNTDYKKPILYHQSDYRTSSSRAHRFLLSAERKFIPGNAHLLCSELKNSWSEYRPKSETTREFQWKINPNRNFREEFAAPIGRVHYLHQFTDKIKTADVIKPLDYFRSRSSDGGPFTNLPKSIKYPSGIESDLKKVEHIWRETHFTDTPGYYPMLDNLVSTTELDFHKHKNYSSAQTNLIVQKELPFNANVAFFTPKSKLIKEYPLCKKYDSKIVRDISKFPTPDFDRITLMRTKCREMKSEMASKF
ncbi:hypothetical protein PVAND_001449 [Polypedilum vanderplanki]|uniref:Uncharacterized protein n=1 Tax=Polypedilum vanderplanki TaxID=319348 RepID=A0A9J6BNF6_POLVA|nr:hypothetical protein PVAND_001449 [Polypedilum vanderplanki]